MRRIGIKTRVKLIDFFNNQVIRGRTLRKDRHYNGQWLDSYYDNPNISDYDNPNISDYDNPNLSVVISIFLAVIVELIDILKLLKCLS
jgi:preprotein translocase subunit Sec61beta